VEEIQQRAMDDQPSIFSTNQFLELELWMKSLPILFRYKRFPFSARKDNQQRDFRQELQLTLELLRRVEQLCQQMTADRKHVSSWALWLEEEAEAIENNGTALDVLADSMKQFKTMLTEMLGHPFVDLNLFDKVGNLLRHEFENFRQSAYFAELNYTYFESKVQPVISSHVLIRTRSIPLKVEVTEIFLNFVRLMAYLRFMNGRLRDAYQPRHFFLVFSLIHFETHILTRRLKAFADVIIRKDVKTGESFQMVTSALRMESRRVFQQELQSIDQAEDENLIRVRLEDSSGLLWNCFQNCFITLAQCFNPSFNRYEVFENIFERYEQSVRLLDDLKRIIGKVEKASDQKEFFGFLADLQSFEQTSMQYLMYKDQLEVHNFVELLGHSNSEDERLHNLHRLSVYLDALIAEVAKRGELKIFYQDERGVMLQ
jgi:hypothetical protein